MAPGFSPQPFSVPCVLGHNLVEGARAALELHCISRRTENSEGCPPGGICPSPRTRVLHLFRIATLLLLESAFFSGKMDLYFFYSLRAFSFSFFSLIWVSVDTTQD